MCSLFIGNSIITLENIDSTNNYAAELLKNTSTVEGTVVFAHEQFAGKGQRGNTWQSEKGKNLTFSILLFPKHIAADEQFLLNKAIALGIYDFLKNELEEQTAIKIKWPNDILVDNKKIAGILIENSLRNNTIQSSIVGIGFNLNQVFFENIPQAISLQQFTKKSYEVMDTLKTLCQFMEYRYLQLKTKYLQKINGDYLEALYRLNESHHFLFKNEIIKATIRGVSREGKLMLEKSDLKQLECNFKEVSFVYS